MRHLAKCFLFGMIVLLVSSLAFAQPPGGGGTVMVQAGPVEAMRSPSHAGINWDDRNFIDPICGVTIVWPRPTPPYSFYAGPQNAWGNPAMIPIPGPPLSPSMWILIFGGPTGPCYSKSDPIFYKDQDTSKEFLGFHIGLYTDVTFGEFLTFPCWWIGENHQTVPCSGLAGYNINGRHLLLTNAAATAMDVQNAAVAFSPDPIPINDLHRVYLPGLEWRALTLRNNSLPAAEGDLPGTLALEIPDELLGRNGFAVFSYDIADPETGEVLSNVTFEFAIPKE